MIPAEVPPDFPLWAALPVALFLVLGAGLALVGSAGLLVLRSFYERVHAPTLGTTLGMGSVLGASLLHALVLGGRPVFHELVIGALMVVTTPVTLMLLTHAALARDRREGRDVPPAAARPEEAHPEETRPEEARPDAG